MKSLLFGGLSALFVLGSSALGASAQVFSSQRSPQNQPVQNGQVQNDQVQNRQVAQSSVIQATFDRDETLYLDRDGTYQYDLVLRQEANFGGRRLPVGSVIRGQFEPAQGGLVYVADSIELGDRIFQLNAVSELMRDDKDPRQTSTGAIVTDAAIGAVGGYVLGEVLGDAGFWEIAGGAATGVLVGSTTAPLVVVVKPDQQIALYSN